jgi:hypothetical protein
VNLRIRSKVGDLYGILKWRRWQGGVDNQDPFVNSTTALAEPHLFLDINMARTRALAIKQKVCDANNSWFCEDGSFGGRMMDRIPIDNWKDYSEGTEELPYESECGPYPGQFVENMRTNRDVYSSVRVVKLREHSRTSELAEALKDVVSSTACSRFIRTGMYESEDEDEDEGRTWVSANLAGVELGEGMHVRFEEDLFQDDDGPRLALAEGTIVDIIDQGETAMVKLHGESWEGAQVATDLDCLEVLV